MGNENMCAEEVVGGDTLFLTIESPAELADMLYILRDRRLELQRRVETLKAEEAHLEKRLIERLDDIKAEGIAGSIAKASINPKIVFNVTNWGALHKYIFETRNLNLLQRKLSVTVLKDLIEENPGGIPGVEEVSIRNVSLIKNRKQ